jgi:tetratricopeptide (TPR) repeat protein
MKKILILAFAVTILSTFSFQIVNAQTKEDAGNAFNAALELSKTNMAGAIVKMQDVEKMCTALGSEGDTLKMKVATVLPVWQFNVANGLIKDKKYDLAIPAYEKSRDMAVSYSDDNIKEKSESMLVKLYANNGNSLLKAEKTDDAINYFEKALKLDPEYSKAYYANGLAYKKKGDNTKMQENMDLAISSATKSNDTVTVQAAKNVISSSLYQEGADLFKKKSYSEAAEKLNSSLAYDTKNKEVFYLLAVSNNNMKKFDECIEAANSGLALEEQTSLKMARFYYEIAKAYEGKSDTPNACENYKKAAVGTFAASANYQMKTVLKCQ